MIGNSPSAFDGFLIENIRNTIIPIFFIIMLFKNFLHWFISPTNFLIRNFIQSSPRSLKCLLAAMYNILTHLLSYFLLRLKQQYFLDSLYLIFRLEDERLIIDIGCFIFPQIWPL